MANVNGRQRLAALEYDVEQKYRELARKELQQRAQEIVDSQGAFSPLERDASGAMPDQTDSTADDSGGNRA